MNGAPERLGRYELLARLATGGMGEVFLARLEGAEGFEKLYAVKRVLPHLANDERFRRMMIAEAQIASRMAHPNICQVYELGETNGQLYIVMEYLEGVTLLQLLRKASREKQPLELGMIASVIGQVCDALQYAHELRDRNRQNMGVVHRDVTPANVFVCENGVCKVLDFGIAKVKDSANTQTDSVKGKFAYMAPEQLKGKELTRRVDIFALGVVTFEMLALRRLFQRQTDYLTFKAVMEEPLADVRRYRPGVPASLVIGLYRALERAADDRFDNVREMREALFSDPSIAPWPHEKIGELVRTRFASEIGATHAGVATAVTKAGIDLGDLVPGKVDSSRSDLEDDDADFPQVDTELAPMPLLRGDQTQKVVEKNPKDVTVVTLPDAPRRSVARTLGAILALVVVAAGAGALWFLYREQNKEDEAALPPQTGDAAVLLDVGINAPEDDDLIATIAPKLRLCVARHPAADNDLVVVLDVAADGKINPPVRYEPESYQGSPLGDCLQKALLTVTLTPLGVNRVHTTQFQLKKDNTAGSAGGAR